MKKTVLMAAVLAVMLFTGCSGVEKSPEAVRQAITEPFKMTATLIDGDYSAEVVVYRLGLANYRVEFLSPQQINGLVISRNQGDVTYTYSQISFDYDYSGMMNCGIIHALSALDKAASAEAITVSGEGGDITQFAGVSVCSVNGIPTELDFGNILLKASSFEKIAQQSPQ